MVFAAGITVPGGNDGSDGLPIFSKRIAFNVFIVSDALSLFTSTTSSLLFLSILTARYSEGDFLHVLPKRLIMGLVTLFLSITTMIVAFSATLCLVFGHTKAWIYLYICEVGNGLPGQKDEYQKYVPLLKAALKGDWEAAKKFFDQDPSAITAQITREKETAVFMAAGTGPAALTFVKELVKLMPVEALAQPDIAGNIPLHLSAWVGNAAAAVLLVKKNPALLCIREGKGLLPVHFAAINEKRDTLLYLLKATDEYEEAKRMLFFSTGSEPAGTELLIQVITSGYYDVALDLVHRHPQIAKSLTHQHDTGLGAIAEKVQAFPSGTPLNYWEHIIYAYAPVKLKNYAKDLGGVQIENPVNNSQLPVQKYHWTRLIGKIFCMPVSPKSQAEAVLWKVFALLVPQVRRIRELKQTHDFALQLVRYLLKEIVDLNDLSMYRSIETKAVVNATRLGIHEVVEEIVEHIPKLASARDSENRTIFQRAVIERHENVFNLIYQMSDHKHSATMLIDESGNNILHIAGRLAPLNKLNLISGAALQMQRELQWFREVEKFVRPSYIESKNKHNETPAMVFTSEHKNLVVAGGEWMKNTADSCTISAALIVTVVFAAAITIPGGNDGSNGLPIFSKKIAFDVFIVSDALSLFTSTTSLLLFLSILTARYSEGDFLHVLPKRLIMGLVTLFLSITTMIVAFSATLCLVVGHTKAWILVPIGALACLPVTAFVLLQFPLLVDLISSTYGRGIFGKQSGRQFF